MGRSLTSVVKAYNEGHSSFHSRLIPTINQLEELHNTDPNKKIEYQDLPDGFFHQESTLLNNPPSELRGLAKNRFYQLYKDPQKYAVEPFSRIGDDTYNDILNSGSEC